MPRTIHLVDVAVAVWAAVWLLAGGATLVAVRQVGEVGDTVATAADGLAETSAGLRRASLGLRQTGDALGAVGALPLVGTSLGDGVTSTGEDLDRIASRVDETAALARANAADTDESAAILAVVLGLAVGLAPVLPVVAAYALLRPLVRARVEGAA